MTDLDVKYFQKFLPGPVRTKFAVYRSYGFLMLRLPEKLPDTAYCIFIMKSVFSLL